MPKSSAQAHADPKAGSLSASLLYRKTSQSCDFVAEFSLFHPGCSRSWSYRQMDQEELEQAETCRLLIDELDRQSKGPIHLVCAFHHCRLYFFTEMG